MLLNTTISSVDTMLTRGNELSSASIESLLQLMEIWMPEAENVKISERNIVTAGTKNMISNAK